MLFANARAVSAAALLASVSMGCAASMSAVPSSEPRAAHAGSPHTVATLAPATNDASAATPREPDPEPEAVPIAGTELVRGRATVTVHAPIDKVREGVLGFAAYPEFMPHYEKCKLLGRTDTGARQVYMEIEALHGAVHMWTQIDLPKPTIVEGVETWETTFVKGNVEDFKAIWRLKKIDDHETSLSLEVFLKPSLRLPVKILNGENLNGAVNGVVAMKRHIQGEKPLDGD